MDEDSYKRTILIDSTSLFDQYSRRGIGRYTRDLLKRLIPLLLEADYKISLIGFLDIKQALIEIGFTQFGVDDLSEKIDYHSLGEPFPSTVKNLINWNKFEEIIFQVEPDIYFATHFERGLPTTKFLKNRVKGMKTIVTVHDTIPLVNGSFSTKSPIHNFLKKRFYKLMWNGVQNADLVLTCSDFSKGDIVKYGKVKAEKVNRVYLGVNDYFRKSEFNYEEHEINEVIDRFQVKDLDYFFYDSGLEKNKGIDNLLNILKEFFGKQTRNDLPKYFLITGGDFYKGRGQEIKPRTENGIKTLAKIKKLELLDNFIATGRLTEDELAILLRNAKSYIYLSEYEGFGFGPVQAMASEIPSIVNDSSCLPEITAGGSLIVDAKKHSKASKEIKSFLRDEEKVKEYLAKGRKISERYDWDITAEETFNAINKLYK